MKINELRINNWLWVVNPMDGSNRTLCKDYYTVLNGVCYQVVGSLGSPSGDTLMQIRIDCKEVGKYNPNKLYSRRMQEYNYGQINKLIKTKK